MATDELTVRGLTGVDMTLTVAGPGTRSYAFVVDWHIRVLGVLAWVLLGAMLRQMFPVSAGGKLTSNPIMLALMVGAGLTYFLYHPVLELAMRGRTPGKRIAGVRIVTVEGEMPGAGALLTRNLFRLIDSLPSFYLLGLVCCFVTRQSVRIGDMAGGTLLVLEAEDSASSLGRLSALLERSSLPPETLKLVQDLLARWKALQKPQRLILARTLLARIEPQRDAAALAALDEASLRALLENHVAR
ncbi:MAG TPA: RDD family protein [Steroidobacteraceae bacterium]